MPVLFVIGLAIVLLTGIGVVSRLMYAPEVDVTHFILSVFFATNLLICFWEVCLFLRQDYIQQRTPYWHAIQRDTGRSAALTFFFSRVGWRQVFSLELWADVWAVYSQYDPSFATRKSFGFNVDIGNGFLTLLPTLLLYAAFTIDFLPAYVTGILGVALFWQWTYMTSIYLVSFFTAGRHEDISRRNLILIIFGTNLPWVIWPLFGLYVSICLIVQGDYTILGL